MRKVFIYPSAKSQVQKEAQIRDALRVLGKKIGTADIINTTNRSEAEAVFAVEMKDGKRTLVRKGKVQ